MTSVQDIRSAWHAADDLGVDTTWVWDHFFPLYGAQDGNHYEAYTLLAAMAADTKQTQFGALVTCNTYRNADLLADMSRNIDHISGGRFVLGIGAGWFQRDYEEYGYEFATAGARAAALERSLHRIKARWEKLQPPPVHKIPILIGAGGEQIMLRLVAEHADEWNWFGSPRSWAAKSAKLDEWCQKVGRDPAQIERSILIESEYIRNWEKYVEAGCHHIIVQTPHPYDLKPVEQLLNAARA
jgi:probable F420-dependent oxidoreductase